MKERLFRFKQFAVEHSLSAMKVGVDAVILGASASPSHSEERIKILDAGCGCGILALMCAQRFPKAEIIGIDIHSPSVEEASRNGRNSPWGGRLRFRTCDFSSFIPDSGLDMIISNPPFFSSGVLPVSDRERSRHIGSFGPETLISFAPSMLSEDGTLAMIYPAQSHARLTDLAHGNGLSLWKYTVVYGRRGGEPKRVVANFKPRKVDSPEASVPGKSVLCIEIAPGQFSEEYISLTKEFYLNF